jgi:UDP-N-acetylglucosamine--N-acetylmuramyl-(pentapeptide) pyrophosphoryl-undecaprenol N-acetylglucosamine transferase
MFFRCCLAITRAGALTIAELEANHLPAILIPLPTAAENHQYYNALAQQEKGVAILLEQSKLTPFSLVENIKKITENLEIYRNKLAALPPNEAAQKIVNYILNYLNNKEEK